jgi:hypothetical protein
MAKNRVPCNQETAAGFGDQAERVHEQLIELSDLAQSALDEWPDAGGTGELRTLLFDVLEAAESGAHRWRELAARLEALAVDAAHLHLIDGAVVAVPDEIGEVDVVDTIDTAVPA